jgi:hypothetical protein
MRIIVWHVTFKKIDNLVDSDKSLTVKTILL